MAEYLDLVPNLGYTFGTKRLIFRTQIVTPDFADRVAEAVKSLKFGNTPYAKLERNEKETNESYEKRYAEYLKQTNNLTQTRSAGESWDAYITRLFKPRLPLIERGFNIINLLAKEFSTEDHPVPQLTDEDFKNASWLEVRCFIYDLLNACELVDEADMFLPKGFVSSALAQESDSGAEAQPNPAQNYRTGKRPKGS